MMSGKRILQTQLIAFMSNRPFHVNRIPNSNLLLIVINSLELGVKSTDILSTKPKEMETGIQYGVVHPCHKLYMNTLPRRRLDECFVSSFENSIKPFIFILQLLISKTDHPDEEETAYCGSVSRIATSMLAIALALLFYVVKFS